MDGISYAYCNTTFDSNRYFSDVAEEENKLARSPFRLILTSLKILDLREELLD